MAKIKVQAQHLQPGDIVGSGEVVEGVILNSTQFPSNKVKVGLVYGDSFRTALWGKCAQITVERADAG